MEKYGNSQIKYKKQTNSNHHNKIIRRQQRIPRGNSTQEANSLKRKGTTDKGANSADSSSLRPFDNSWYVS